MARPLTLYYSPFTRASRGLWMLEELDEPYALRLIDTHKGEQRNPAYLAINPTGKVPTLRDGEHIIRDSAAICAYLADRFPGAGLAPATDAPERASYLTWLFYAASNVEPAVMVQTNKWPVPSVQTSWGSYETVIETLAGAVRGGPYLLGKQFTAADVVLGSMVRFCLANKLLPARPELGAYVARLEARPALQRTMKIEAEYAARLKA
ncbi:glutathione S-transferase family protein [Vineibacter terrae]|nr:glutathione S-transferase family protein [Vineibacter terrae]